MRKLLVILVTFLLMVNGTGCSLLGIGNVKKRYTLEERRAAVMQYLEEKYGEKFIEISVEPEGFWPATIPSICIPKPARKKTNLLPVAAEPRKGLRYRTGISGY